MSFSSTPAGQGSRSVILMVDDIEANLQTLDAVLEDPEWELHSAADGATALAKAASLQPDLILLDVMMPVMDGFEVCSRLRGDPHLAEIPILMVTSLDDRASRLRGIDAGADDFVAKPFDVVELRARVRTITRLKRHRRLHEQRKQFQWVVEHARDGYVLVDAGDRILFANACARTWMGLDSLSKNGVPEKFLSVASRMFACQPAHFWKDWPDTTGTKASSGFLIRPETEDAAAFFLEVSIHENSGGRLLCLRDVTARLATRRDHRSFQAMVAHKLRTPVNGLCGSLQLLADPAKLSAGEITEFALIAQEAATRLSSTVDGVLRFAESSRHMDRDGRFALTGLYEAIHRVAAGLGLGAVSLSLADAVRESSIGCAPESMEWVLFELLENSKKFHPGGTPVVRVAVSSAGADRISLVVSDDGRTLAPEQLARAGTPFFQGDKDFTGEVPGMGLGLANVFALVWQHGGSCRLTNHADGPGVCVELQWPSVARKPEPPAGSDVPPGVTPQEVRVP